MSLSRDVLVVNRSPWESTKKTSQWLQSQAKDGWFLDSFKFRFFCTVANFTFKRCEPIDAEFIYCTMFPQTFSVATYEEELEEGYRVLAYAENYVAITNVTPVFAYQDINATNKKEK